MGAIWAYPCSVCGAEHGLRACASRVRRRAWTSSGRVYGHISMGGIEWRRSGHSRRWGRSACSAWPSASGRARATCSNPPKIMVVMMENEGASNIIGNPALPYVTSLANDYGSATAVLRLRPIRASRITSTSSRARTRASPTTTRPRHTAFPAVPTLADQLVAAGDSMDAYAESLPADPTNDSGLYAVRHNPWEYFPSAPVTVKRLLVAHPRPERRVASGLRVVHARTSPTTATPASPPTPRPTSWPDTESFLSSFIPSVQATSWYKVGGPDHHRVGRSARQRHVRSQRWRRGPCPHHRGVEVPGQQSAVSTRARCRRRGSSARSRCSTRCRTSVRPRSPPTANINPLLSW